MTITTDIAALRRRSNNLRTADQTDAFIDLLLDKLEAERQRVDDAAALNKHLDLSIRQSEVVNANLRDRAEKAEASAGVLEGINARKEFDSQKGEHVLVTMDALRDAVAEMSGGSPLKWREGTDKGHHGVPFINFNSLHRIVTKFTTPLKPVESCD